LELSTPEGVVLRFLEKVSSTDLTTDKSAIEKNLFDGGRGWRASWKEISGDVSSDGPQSG
jgi:hypothetical protein